MEKSINKYVEEAIKKNWNELALTDFNGDSFRYCDIARKIAKLHLLFSETGVKKGDKIAICGKNSAQWAVAFLASLTYGAIPVPLLHEFKPDNLHHLVNHCEAKLFFVDSSIWENLEPQKLSAVLGVIRISDYAVFASRSKSLTEGRKKLNALFGEKYPERFTAADVSYYEPAAEDLAVINYTSGSTGNSKGVMVPQRALASNIQYTIDHLHFLKPTDGMVCMLPLAHMYGLVVELIHPLVKGCHVYFLTKVPSPRVLLDAFARVHPKLIVTVPLVIEKIIKGRVFPLLEKPIMKLLLKVPFLDDRLLAKVKSKITETFGGELQELIIGGAALNKEVDDFLRRIEFPITVGYGMTECAPLITYAPWRESKSGSCGRVVDRMELRIDSKNPQSEAGELWVRGANVMLGYYHNEEATKAVIKDGWMNTGDLCNIDADGFLFIRGRSKNMILGPSGQNIYPEEIEQLINNLPYVNESLVVEDHGKLTALIYPDFDTALAQGYDNVAIEALMNENIQALNKEIPSYSRLSGVRIFHEEFEKTPKRSIKRFMYQH